MRTYIIFAAFVIGTAASVEAEGRNNSTLLIRSGAPICQGECKVAIIDTRTFVEPNLGIRRLVEAISRVNKEFQPRRAELEVLRQRHQSLVSEYHNIRAAHISFLNRMLRDIEAREKELEDKSRAIESGYEKRLRELANPIYRSINGALESFAQLRGFIMVLDSSKAEAVILGKERMINITREFIDEYNRQNPASL